jgi:tetratricopeptide (TPR) repeat protein
MPLRPQALLHTMFAVALTVPGLFLGGCGPHNGATPPVNNAERTTPASSSVSDDGFGPAVHDLLLSAPGSAERHMRLGAVEARQMAHAADRFRARQGERGLAAVNGALYLVHVGEATDAIFGPQGRDALDAAAKELAAKGDEGRARAVYDLLLRVAPPSDRGDIGAHLGAIDRWTKDAVASGGPLESYGSLERIAMRRRLLEPSADALSDATTTATEWIRRAMELRERFQKVKMQPSREEAAEAWRALETGPALLAAAYLRDGDVAAALAAVDHAQARGLMESERAPFAAALESAAQGASPERCLELLHQVSRLAGRDGSHEDEVEFAEDHDVFAAASFSVASECYRLDPTVPEVAFTLGMNLEELGMAEATPAVLAEATRAHPQARFVGEALALTLDAMAREEDAADAPAARRAFRAAQPILSLAADGALAGKVHPSAARVRAVMGEIELREGRLEDAKGLLKASADEEKSGAVLLSLGRIEWRDKDAAALGHLRDALAAPDAGHDPALRGEVLLMISDVMHDQGDLAAARTPLDQALKELVQSRNVPGADARARVERVLARVLDRFGAAQPAQRALERAYAAAPGDKRQATQTIELVIGRAFVRGDIGAAREGLQRALGADLQDDDLVYFALWVRLLERQLHATTDGVPDRVFASVRDESRWVATLAHFGSGKIKGDDLIAHAGTPIQKYEALFYDAMDRRAAGDTKGGDDLLRQVIAGTGLELSEVTFARDMLDPSKSQLGGPLPVGVSIP